MLREQETETQVIDVQIPTCSAASTATSEKSEPLIADKVVERQERWRRKLGNDVDVVTVELVADDELAARLGCRPGQRWLRLRTTRGDPRDPSHPIAATTVYIDPAYGPAVRREVASSRQLISTIIEEAYGTYTAEVRQEIRAVAITAGPARALGCEPGSPGLEITRHYSDPAGRPFVITISVQPADRFSYVIKLTRLGCHAAAPGATQSA